MQAFTWLMHISLGTDRPCRTTKGLFQLYIQRFMTFLCARIPNISNQWEAHLSLPFLNFEWATVKIYPRFSFIFPNRDKSKSSTISFNKWPGPTSTSGPNVTWEKFSPGKDRSPKCYKRFIFLFSKVEWILMKQHRWCHRHFFKHDILTSLKQGKNHPYP